MRTKHSALVIMLFLMNSAQLSSQNSLPSLNTENWHRDSTTVRPFINQNPFQDFSDIRRDYHIMPEFRPDNSWLFRNSQDYDAFRRTMTSLSNSLNRFKPMHSGIRTLFGLFFNSPLSCPEGYIPMSATSGPLRTIYWKVPGNAPLVSPLAPDDIPLCVTYEYDSFSREYKPVMVDWTDIQLKMDANNGKSR